MQSNVKQIDFGSYLAYTPDRKYNKVAEQAYKALHDVKRLIMIHPNVSVVDYLIDEMASELSTMPFSEFFADDPILVPVPRSTVTRKNTLWVPLEICKSLERHRLGKTEIVLKRKESIAVSSQSRAEQRPSPSTHYRSLSLQTRLQQLRKIVLVDDVITRGHTFLGCAWRLAEAFPGASIMAFSLFRTVSNPSEFRGLKDPVKGSIKYRPEKDDCLRRP